MSLHGWYHYLLWSLIGKVFARQQSAATGTKLRLTTRIAFIGVTIVFLFLVFVVTFTSILVAIVTLGFFAPEVVAHSAGTRYGSSSVGSCQEGTCRTQGLQRRKETPGSYASDRRLPNRNKRARSDTACTKASQHGQGTDSKDGSATIHGDLRRILQRAAEPTLVVRLWWRTVWSTAIRCGSICFTSAT